jgi:hypothetical protein
MTTGNLDTLGRLQITCNKSTYQMPPIGLVLVPAMVFDSMVLGTDRFDTNVTHVADTSQTAGDLYASQVAIAGYIDTEVSAIKAKTDNLPSDPADQSAVEAAITAATSPLATQASVNTIDDFLDTEIAAIKTKTDQLTFTVANKVDSTAELDSASVDAIWNEVLTGATHNIASSAGRRLRQLADTVVLVDGVCDAASNAGTDSTGTITLEVGTTTACVGQALRCENQVRFIASYDAGTRVAQLDRPWCVVPDAGDEYVIFNVRNPLVGLASLALAGSTAAVINDINTVAEKIDTGLVLDGVVYQFTANMLELGPSGGGGSTVNVLPATGIVANRTPGATLTPVVGETISQSITLYSTDGITPINLSGKTLVVVFETLAGTDVVTVASANITISGANSNVVTFAYPSAVTTSERTLRFAIRDAAAPLTMYLQGLCSVVRAPQVDP